MSYTTFIKNNTNFTFIEGSQTPNNLPITGIANIAYLDSNFVVIKDKNNLSNLIFGHIEEGETPEQALERESMEEAGIHVNNIVQIGYIFAEKKSNTTENSQYPNKSAINVYISFITFSEKRWEPQETLERSLMSFKKAVKAFSDRNDNNQLIEILRFAKSHTKQLNYKIEFEFKNTIFDSNIPVSQVFNFAKNSDNLYCIVRDFDESHFSLPGGGCDLGESIEECCIRETFEEAQIRIDKILIIGVYILTYKNKENQIIHKVQHIRTSSNTTSCDQFIPRLNGFETVERSFIKKENLKENIEWLNYEGGEYLLNSLK
jgi:8-oxo-dGTP pyrophosphatase MutT (NUDIX family)